MQLVGMRYGITFIAMITTLVAGMTSTMGYPSRSHCPDRAARRPACELASDSHLELKRFHRTAFDHAVEVGNLKADLCAAQHHDAKQRARKSGHSVPVAKPGPGTAQLVRPNRQLRPDQVVKIQMSALQHNDVPKPDTGITTTFAFASPQNRLATGPLSHFTEIVKAPAYFPMLNCKTVTYELISINGDTAQQRVHIVSANGERITYVFMLSRQQDGVYAGCWMNDGCVRDDAGEQLHRFDA